MFYLLGYLNSQLLLVISSFHLKADESCALLGYHAASSRNSLATFRGILSVPSSRVNNPRILEP